MENGKNTDVSQIETELNRLDDVLDGKKHLLIVVHNNPDPDAIASAAALGYLAGERCNVKCSIAYSGYISRAENRAMVKKLNIHLKLITRIKLTKYDCYALVDTQPGAGNNSLPEATPCDIVVDHHPELKKRKGKLSIIKPDLGVSATILVEWLRYLKKNVPPKLATALSYAISSETQNLGRETSRRDIQAYLWVYVQANMRKLAEILHPKLTNSYFVTLAKALNRAVTFRHFMAVNLGEVPFAEIVSEMADFLLRHERISWTICTGRFKGRLFISLRTQNQQAKGGKLLKQLVPDSNTVGGHDTIAGGFIDISDLQKTDVDELESELLRKFTASRGYKDGEWKPLLEKQRNNRKEERNE